VGRFLIRRLLGALIVVIGVSTIVFVVLRFTGDPVALLAPPESSKEDLEAYRRLLGLDKPVPVQYVEFMRGLATGDLGESFRYSEPVTRLVLERLPATIQLALAAIIFALAFAIPLGVLAAVKRDSIFDTVASIFAFVGMAMPVFWLGQMLIILVAVRLNVLPTSGYGSWQHLILPMVTLGTYPLAQFTRLVRSEMLEILRQDFIRTAHAKGLRSMTILFRHALSNAGISLVTLVGLNVGVLLGGAIITETIFAWPGLGRLVVQAIEFRDFPLIQGAVIFIALITVGINLIVDLLYGILDPRTRLS